MPNQKSHLQIIFNMENRRCKYSRFAVLMWLLTAILECQSTGSIAVGDVCNSSLPGLLTSYCTSKTCIVGRKFYCLVDISQGGCVDGLTCCPTVSVIRCNVTAGSLTSTTTKPPLTGIPEGSVCNQGLEGSLSGACMRTNCNVSGTQPLKCITSAPQGNCRTGLVCCPLLLQSGCSSIIG